MSDVAARALTALGLLLCASSLGCAAGVSLAAAPSIDTTGHLGAEGRGEIFAATGNEAIRLRLGVAGVVGYQDAFRSGHATVSPEVGVEGGRAVQWSVAASYAPRVLFEGPLDVAHGGGVAACVLFKIRRMGGEDGSLLIGPRLSAELTQGPLLAGRPQTMGLFQLALVLRWTMFDTTGKSWTN